MEIVYALRRTNTKLCLDAINALRRLIDRHPYTYFEATLEYESVNCLGVKANFGASLRHIQLATAKAQSSRYPVLLLKVRSLSGAFSSAVGRFEAAWESDLQGLATFWGGPYPPERGFQFYSDLALTAEQEGLWQMAADLQSECLTLLASTTRSRHKALAHLHRATALYKFGQAAAARDELALSAADAKVLIDKDEKDRIPLALTNLVLVDMDLDENKTQSASSRLMSIGRDIRKLDNFEVTVPYLQAQSRLYRALGQPDQERKFLRQEASLILRGLSNLRFRPDRWAWYQNLDASYHRLMELELQSGTDNTKVLSEWEKYRSALADRLPRSSSGSTATHNWLTSRLNSFRHSTFVSFLLFEDRMDIWVADANAINHVQVPIHEEMLHSQIEEFLAICSDKNAKIQKVKSAATRLYEQLFAPIEPWLDPERTVTIEADGFLDSVPWALLAEKDGRYTGEIYMITNTPALPRHPAEDPVNQPGPANPTLVVYPGSLTYEGEAYPPLPHGEEEAWFVHTLHSGKYLHDEQATAENFLNGLRHSCCVLFTGHAIMRNHYGGLLLTGPQGGEILPARAFQDLHLKNVELIVLSACSTAGVTSGITTAPDSLVSSLLSAGARKVIATRWLLDSGGAFDTMKEFYSSSRNHSVPSALREMRRKFAKDGVHPYFWGPYELFTSVN